MSFGSPPVKIADPGSPHGTNCTEIIGDARAGRALRSCPSVLSVGAICSGRTRRSLRTDLASASPLVEQAANDLREQICARQ